MNDIELYTALRNACDEVVRNIENELVDYHIRTVYENLENEVLVEKELDDCTKELRICYELKRRLNEYVEKHLYSSQKSPLA